MKRHTLAGFCVRFMCCAFSGVAIVELALRGYVALVWVAGFAVVAFTWHTAGVAVGLEARPRQSDPRVP